MKKIISFIIVGLLFISFSSFAGNSDSLNTVFNAIKKVKNSHDRLIKYNDLLRFCWQNGQNEEAVKFGKTVIKEAFELKEYNLAIDIDNNIGIAYDYLGNYPSALHHFFRALSYSEKYHNKEGEAYSLSNIGLIYGYQQKYTEALKFHKLSVAIRREIKSVKGLSASLNNLAMVYMELKQFDKAIQLYEETAKVDAKLGDINGQGSVNNNLGVCYEKMAQFDKALYYHKRSLFYKKQIIDPIGITYSHFNIGVVYHKLKRLPEAMNELKQAELLAKEHHFNELLRKIYFSLHQVSINQNNYKQAYEYYLLYEKYHIQIENQAAFKRQTQQELSYQFRKKEEATRLKQVKKDLEIKKSQETTAFILYTSIFVAIIIFIFSIVLFKRWKLAKEQATIIEAQKQLVLEKNTEILDSITYAKRIQTAILPSETLRAELLSEHFIVYEPKDIVAGDFYWIEQLNDWTLVAAADCTGHGVPGAMMSVVCHNALNRSVREFGLTLPGEILDKTRELIVQELSKNNEQVNDGMDISLCAWNKSTQQLRWSGANNPLWIIRKNGTIEEVKPLKQPIGKYDDYSQFPTHEIQIEKGDLLYLFTDGYSDQFGGETGKKFKTKNFKRLLESISSTSLIEQKTALLDTFIKWKGDLEQVDDICIIGLKM